METKVILKYRRECDSWLCPECDLENPATIKRCSVCDCVQPMGIGLLKAWTPEDDIPAEPPKKTARDKLPKSYGDPLFQDMDERNPRGKARKKSLPKSYDEPLFKDLEEPRTSEPPSSTPVVGILWGIVIGIVLLVLILLTISNGDLSSLLSKNQELCRPTLQVAQLKPVIPETEEISPAFENDRQWTASKRQENLL